MTSTASLYQDISLHRELQSGETDIILNTIDELRSLGIGSILELPQIIVCGDQSSGKSSVLNAVSGLKFPTKDGLCTRFATEVIMRKGNPEHVRVTIVPEPGRTYSEKLKLEGFTRSNVSMDDIEDLIDQATATMGIDPNDPRARRFSGDILRFEVTGPNQPSLTLVDLPGLFQAPNQNQTEEDTESVRTLVLQYMENKRSVILAVISAKSEFVLQSVTKYSRKVDPRGERTLGIITKPDKLDEGSQSEKSFIELAENRQAFLHLGWHVLVNRDHNTRNYTQTQRDDFEKQYLSRGVWARLPSNHKGVFTLRSRLSVILREQILKELPNLIKEAEELVTRCTSTLTGLGVSRATAEDRRRYLMQAAQTFNITMRSSINGAYDDRFFNSDGKGDENPKRLRAVVQNTLMQYSDDMHHTGHANHIVDDLSDDDEGRHPRKITQQAFEDRVIKLMKHARGCELMGTYNPMIVRELFLIQSEPWDTLAERYRLKICKAAKTTINFVLTHATDKNTQVQLERHIITPALDRLVTSLEEMIQRLLTPRHESHPITYNRRLAESIQKSKQNFAEKMLSEAYDRSMSKHGEVVSREFLEWLFKEQVAIPSANLDRFAASETIDVMRAYYKIAKETMVDNFSNLAIEQCLISQIPDLLSSEVINNLSDEMISNIATETETAAWERSTTEAKLELCSSAVAKLKNVEGKRIPVLRYSDVQRLYLDPKFDLTDDKEDSERQNGTDISKLDWGLSDREDQQISTSSHVRILEETQGSQRGRSKKSFRV